MEKKPASLLVVFLGETLNAILLSSCDSQVAGPSRLSVMAANFTEDLQTDHELIQMVVNQIKIL